MPNFHNGMEQCSICRHDYTSKHVEAMPGLVIFVCDSCLEASKYNFIWLCMNCGKVYMRPKKMVLQRLKDPVLKRAYMLCQDMQIIQGIDMCIECDPQGIVNYMKEVKPLASC